MFLFLTATLFVQARYKTAIGRSSDRKSPRRRYNVSSIPQTTFIDANGNVYTTRIGAMNEAALRSYITALLGG